MQQRMLGSIIAPSYAPHGEVAWLHTRHVRVLVLIPKAVRHRLEALTAQFEPACMQSVAIWRLVGTQSI